MTTEPRIRSLTELARLRYSKMYVGQEKFMTQEEASALFRHYASGKAFSPFDINEGNAMVIIQEIEKARAWHETNISLGPKRRAIPASEDHYRPRRT